MNQPANEWRTTAEEQGLQFSNYHGLVSVICSDTKIILDVYSSKKAPKGKLQRLAQCFLSAEINEGVNK